MPPHGTIWVCPISRVHRVASEHKPSHVLSLIDPGASVETPAGIAPERHLTLRFLDIDEANVSGGPKPEHVRAITDFLATWDGERPLLVHCHAAVSRSPATALVALAMSNPGRELDAVKALRQSAPHVMPNRLIVSLADSHLNLGGRLREALERLGTPRRVSRETFSLQLTNGASTAPRAAVKPTLRVALWDLDPHVVSAWTSAFGRYEGVSFGCGNILSARVDALVSPANSHGFMDGGIDLAYRNFFGFGLENRVRALIEAMPEAALPVGEAVIVKTGSSRFDRMVFAPTMDRPRDIRGTDNVYRATRAALRCALTADPPIDTLGLPGMGTGVGRMDPTESAEQMRRAFVEVMNPKTLF